MEFESKPCKRVPDLHDLHWELIKVRGGLVLILSVVSFRELGVYDEAYRNTRSDSRFEFSSLNTFLNAPITSHRYTHEPSRLCREFCLHSVGMETIHE